MPEARDGEELRHALQQPEHRALEVADRMHEGAEATRCAVFGPVLNQAKTKHASPTRNAAMPCFTWWWLEPA